MEIKWLGTAGFSIKTKDQVFLIDPYLTRNQTARPVQNLNPSNIEMASQIFISHGHFDHIQDVPEIAGKNHAPVFCSAVAADSLEKMGLAKNQVIRVLSDMWEKDFDDFKAQSFFSSHIKFDKKLMISTLLKIRFQLPKCLKLLKDFPCGQVLSWRFFVENKVIHFFGSAGSSIKELENLGDQPIDILLVPLQGHSDICNIAANYVKKLKPKMVIPHHQDDFYPPISQQVEIKPFVDKVSQECPDVIIKVLQLNEVLHL
jgi:L-ascorbate metabolism protein UlaG (beta-lactamase superfamily)